ncbi:DNA primase family protein [Virgibacillus halodenitrificans]|uniref:SF3 helicase domain-containing protein n=1 Tax=Virgibacillus halodenitrificans TaxID=1482 RepID=A0ABR7VLJ4_VIRHA|nr:DNA primase family protein [Virgibacillus halodenitrificans]MBD1222781.1 hypothetical protein [Virgibacillus halodenitrificans]
MEIEETIRINPFGCWEIGKAHSPIAADDVKASFPQVYHKQVTWFIENNKGVDLKNILTEEDYNHKKINYDSNLEEIKKEPNKKNVDWKKDIELHNFFHEKTNKFVPARLGKVINKYMDLFFDGSTLYYYENGVYISQGEPRLNKVIQNILKDESNSHRKREVIDWLKTNTDIRYKNKKVNPDDGWINVKNGLLNLKTRELRPHTSKRLSTIQLPVNYDPNSDNSKVHNFIKSVVHKESIDLVYEMVGYLLTSHTKAQKAFIFQSGGGSGKSVIVTMLQAFIGNGNYSAVPAQDIDGDRFSAIQLKGKVLNIVDDMKKQRFADTGKFKSSVTGGDIMVEQKGKPQEIIKPIAKHVFCMNAIPDSGDMSEAWSDRWIMIPLPNRFRGGENEDKQLPEKLTREDALSTLLNYALDGLERLRSNNYRFSENKHTEKLKNNHLKESNPMELFIDEHCKLGEGLEEIADTVYKVYKSYCEDDGYKPLTKIKFNKYIKNKFDLESYRPNKNNKKPTWKGISLR